MSELVLAAGSIAGAFTALALERASSRPNPASHSNDGSWNNEPELESRLLQQAIKRVHDYERAGKITGTEREQLLAKYRAQLESTHLATGGLGIDGSALQLFGKDLAALLDQRFALMSAKIEELRSGIGNIPAQAKNSYSTELEKKPVDMKIDKTGQPAEHISQQTQPVPAVDATESVEGDGSLEELKKQIMQTLSRLEQAEVE